MVAGDRAWKLQLWWVVLGRIWGGLEEWVVWKVPVDDLAENAYMGGLSEACID